MEKKATLETMSKTLKNQKENEKAVSNPANGYRDDLENGGYVLSFYHDGNGNKVEKEKAKSVISTVFDSNGNRIQEVYGNLSGGERKQEDDIKLCDNSKYPVVKKKQPLKRLLRYLKLRK